MIQSEFENKAGAALVKQKLYHIVTADGQMIKRESWNKAVLPGSSIAMSMVMRNLRVRGNQCPRPGCSGTGEPGLRFHNLLQW